MTIRGMLSVCACFVMYLVSGVVGVVVPEHQSAALHWKFSEKLHTLMFYSFIWVKE